MVDVAWSQKYMGQGARLVGHASERSVFLKPQSALRVEPGSRSSETIPERLDRTARERYPEHVVVNRRVPVRVVSAVAALFEDDDDCGPIWCENETRVFIGEDGAELDGNSARQPYVSAQRDLGVLRRRPHLDTEPSWAGSRLASHRARPAHSL